MIRNLAILTILCATAAFAEAKPFNEEPTKVGVILPLSGPFARYGQQVQKALQQHGFSNLQFIFEDEECEPLKAMKAFRRLSDQFHIQLFLGPTCGSPQMVIAPLLSSKNAISILPCSAPKDVFSVSQKRMFSSQHSIERESQFNAEKIFERGAKRVVIFMAESDFGRMHERAFKEKFKGEVVDTLTYTSDDPLIVKGLILRIKNLNPDALYVPDVYPLLSGFLKELRLAGMEGLPVYSIYAVQSEDVKNILQAENSSLFYSYPDIGEKDALEYFPMLAAEMMSQVVKTCDGTIKCIHEKLLDDSVIGKDGAPAGQFVLKELSDGRYQLIP